ncbi:MAG TPA: hypothetical protein VFE62_25485 [Gemmataceae bacterium]|nr:hypothetical protein [Gemmataceae bacterium]
MRIALMPVLLALLLPMAVAGQGFKRVQIHTIEFAPDGKTLASGSEDGIVKVWNTADGKLAREFPGHLGHVYGLSYSLDGKQLAVASGKRHVIHYNSKLEKIGEELPEGEIKLWDLESGKPLKTVVVSNGMACAVKLAGSKNALHSLTSNGVLDEWDTQTWKRKNLQKYVFIDEVAILISADGNLVAWSTDTGIKIADRARKQEWVCRHAGTILSLANTHDNQLVASASTDVKLWNTNTGKEVGEITGFASGIAGLAFSPDKKLLATASAVNGPLLRRPDRISSDIKIWRVSDRSLASTVVVQDDCVECIAFSPDGRTLVSGHWSGTIKLWNVPEIPAGK